MSFMQTGIADMAINPIAASAEDLLDVALKYSLGRGVKQDNVQAHMWLNLAAMKGSKVALQYRCELAREMSPSQVADALRQARALLTIH
jgi:uncharacterized protein